MKRPLAVRLLDRLPSVEKWPPEHRQFRELAGLRGVRIGILLEPIYRLQVRAILEAARRLGSNFGRTVELIVPYVIDPGELDRVQAMVREEEEKYQKRNASRMRKFKILIGPMIETPRAIALTGEFAERSDFLSYGTNDLTELVFGLDKEEESLPGRYIGLKILHKNPALTLDASVKQLIRASVRRARDRKPDITLGVAAEHAYDVESVEFFLRTGFNYVSTIYHHLPVARFAVAKASIKLGLTS
jgi:pyruvate,orthophosphate dikinase